MPDHMVQLVFLELKVLRVGRVSRDPRVLWVLPVELVVLVQQDH